MLHLFVQSIWSTTMILQCFVDPVRGLFHRVEESGHGGLMPFQHTRNGLAYRTRNTRGVKSVCGLAFRVGRCRRWVWAGMFFVGTMQSDMSDAKVCHCVHHACPRGAYGGLRGMLGVSPLSHSEKHTRKHLSSALHRGHVDATFPSKMVLRTHNTSATKSLTERVHDSRGVVLDETTGKRHTGLCEVPTACVTHNTKENKRTPHGKITNPLRGG
jgi:hypothetical protein